MGTPRPTLGASPVGVVDRAAVAPEMVVAIQATLAALDRCRAAGDVSGALALFTADAARRLMTGGVDEAASDDATQATPVVSAERLPIIPPIRDEDLRMRVDGRVGAAIPGGVGSVLFREQAGRWLIDEVGDRPVATATEPAGEAMVEPAVAAAREAAADMVGVGVDGVEVDGVEPRDWPDTAIGCPEAETMYADVITPGYVVRVVAGGQTVEVHTDATGERTAIC